jgi:hypothetical protein
MYGGSRKLKEAVIAYALIAIVACTLLLPLAVIAVILKGHLRGRLRVSWGSGHEASILQTVALTAQGIVFCPLCNGDRLRLTMPSRDCRIVVRVSTGLDAGRRVGSRLRLRACDCEEGRRTA